MTADKLIIAGYDVPLCDTVRPEEGLWGKPYFKQEKKREVLPKGWQLSPEHRALPCEMVYEQNEEMRHSDGVKIYYDVCRPNNSEKVPAILALSPYGKGHLLPDTLDVVPFRIGVAKNRLSGLQKFECVDPAEWVNRGYAVINVDVRGSWESEGNLFIEGMPPGHDGAEIVEHIASLPWCNGSIGMHGNSWPAAVSWETAVAAPPSLKAIAPWEGFTDKYRQVACRGGIPDATFLNLVYNKTIRGRQKREDIFGACLKWPLINDYWEDKVIKTEKINIPIYAVASYCSGIHPLGTIEGWRRASSPKKWLRIHCTQEWYDQYREDMVDELQSFFDRYLKGVDNCWERTNPVRASILTCADRFGPKPLEHVPIGDWPHKDTAYTTLYIQSQGLSRNHPSEIGKGSYHSENSKSNLEFTYVFSDSTTVLGYSKVKLWVSCDDADDMDIYVSLHKVDSSGKMLEHINIPWHALPSHVSSQEDVTTNSMTKFFGPTGILRVSHRRQDPSKADSILPYHPHDKIEKVTPGNIVPVEIGIWPAGFRFYKGEGIMIRIRGSKELLEMPNEQSDARNSVNKGFHHIHYGGGYDSHLTIPIVPGI